jgi:hypothetical protein
MATAAQREIFLNEGRVFIQCPQLMTDGESVDALAQRASPVGGRLFTALSADAPKLSE